MRNKNKGYNQLMIIDNTEENHNIIKELNNKMKEFNSRWRINKKYRLPKKDCKYGWGGSLCKDDANGIGIYLYTTKKYNKVSFEERRKYIEERISRERIEINELREENRFLKLQLDEYKKTEEINFLGRLKNNLMDTPEELDSYEEDIINRIKERLK